MSFMVKSKVLVLVVGGLWHYTVISWDWGRGTLHFPFPVSNGLAAAKRRRRRWARWRTRTITSASFPQLRGRDPVQDLRGEIEDPQSLHFALPVGTRLRPPAWPPEIGCTLCRKELRGAIKSKGWIHIGVTHYKTFRWRASYQGENKDEVAVRPGNYSH